MVKPAKATGIIATIITMALGSIEGLSRYVDDRLATALAPLNTNIALIRADMQQQNLFGMTVPMQCTHCAEVAERVARLEVLLADK